MRVISTSAAILLAGLMSGCSKDPPDKGPAPEAAKYLLSAEPPGAKPVKEVRQNTKGGEEVVVIGRIGGGKDPWVADRAGFWIVDPVLPPCSEECRCPTPWDYCCEKKEDLASATAFVEIVDASGKVVSGGAKKTLGLKELDTVVVRGVAERDKDGNLTVRAKGVFVKK